MKKVNWNKIEQTLEQSTDGEFEDQGWVSNAKPSMRMSNISGLCTRGMPIPAYVLHCWTVDVTALPIGTYHILWYCFTKGSFTHSKFSVKLNCQKLHSWGSWTTVHYKFMKLKWIPWTVYMQHLKLAKFWDILDDLSYSCILTNSAPNCAVIWHLFGILFLINSFHSWAVLWNRKSRLLSPNDIKNFYLGEIWIFVGTHLQQGQSSCFSNI